MVSCSTYGKHTKSLFYCIFGIFFCFFPPSTTLDYSNNILINFVFYFLGKKTFWNCWRFVWEVISIWVLMDKSIRIWLCRQKGVSLSILRKSPIALTERVFCSMHNLTLNERVNFYMDPLLVKLKCISIFKNLFAFFSCLFMIFQKKLLPPKHILDLPTLALKRIVLVLQPFTFDIFKLEHNAILVWMCQS